MHTHSFKISCRSRRDGVDTSASRETRRPISGEGAAAEQMESFSTAESGSWAAYQGCDWLLVVVWQGDGEATASMARRGKKRLKAAVVNTKPSCQVRQEKLKMFSVVLVFLFSCVELQGGARMEKRTEPAGGNCFSTIGCWCPLRKWWVECGQQISRLGLWQPLCYYHNFIIAMKLESMLLLNVKCFCAFKVKCQMRQIVSSASVRPKTGVQKEA